MKEEGREMVYKGPLKRRGGSQSDSGELLVFLLDHALLMVKQKNKADQFKVYRRVREKSLLNIPPLTRYYYIADSAGTAAHHCNRRIRHASHRLPPPPQQLQPKR